MSIDELELLRRAGQVDPLPDDSMERAELLLRAAMAVPESETIGATTPANRPRFYTGRRFLRAGGAVAAGALVLAGAGICWVAARGSGQTGAARTRPPVAKAVLTAVEVRQITTRSAAAASSGTAVVSQLSAIDGTAQDGFNSTVTFSGPNIDERITPVPEAPGSSTAFTTDDRLVDGQFYIYTPGPNDVLEWMHDTNSADDVASMQFPDPRTLYRALTPAAEFTVAGTATMNGESVTDLVAADPSSVDTSALGNLTANGKVTSFEIWIDASDVVQRITISTSSTSRVCRFGAMSAVERKALLSKYGTTLSGGGNHLLLTPAAIRALGGAEVCAPETTTSSTTVAFAQLGVPQSITAPAGAIDFSGRG